MAEAVAQEKDHYRSALAHMESRTAPDWLKRLRAEAAAQFDTLEFPHRKMEEWRFTNVNPIVRTPFKSLTEPGVCALSIEDVARYKYNVPGWTELVFVDGFHVEALSTSGALAEPFAGSLSSALAADSPDIHEHLGKLAGQNGNIFNALNAAFLLDGGLVHVPRNTAVEAPIHLIHIITENAGGSAAHPHGLVVLEEGAEATVIETHVGASGTTQYLNNAATELSLGPNAKLEYYKIVEEGDSGYHLAATTCRMERDSVLNAYTCTLSGKIVRNAIAVKLDGENADCNLNGLYLLDQEQLVDNNTFIEHAAPHCTSWIGYKGVLDDKSHGVFSGRIYVHRAAQKTDSKQLNGNLLLSDRATIDTKPLLEIFADDVKCTHGATIGRPPSQQIFYFQSRGIDKKRAEGLLTYGFAGEIIGLIKIDVIRERLDKYAFNKYCARERVQADE